MNRNIIIESHVPNLTREPYKLAPCYGHLRNPLAVISTAIKVVVLFEGRLVHAGPWEVCVCVGGHTGPAHSSVAVIVLNGRPVFKR
jgi:hypothetical protein